MKKLMLVALMSAFAFQAHATVSRAISDSTLLKYEIPSEFPGEASQYLEVGNRAAAAALLAKVGTVDLIWADQQQVTVQNGGMFAFNTRVSAQVQGRWVHQTYRVQFVYGGHSAQMSPLVLLSESAD